MSTVRFLGIAFAVFIAAWLGHRWLFAVQPLKPDARIPTFHRVDPNDPREQFRNSYATDDDNVRNALRQAVYDAASDLADEPCNDALKARYVEAATKYARAWLSIAPCVDNHTCGDRDGVRLDRAQQAFGTPLDARVRDKMVKAHETGAVRPGDFPKDAVSLVAEFARDPVINPFAAPQFKKMAEEMRSAPSCRAASLQ